MRLYRTRDASLINQICAKPGIREACGFGDHQVPDFSEPAARDDHIILTNGFDACVLAVIHNPAVIEVHCAFDVTCRGRMAIEAWETAFAYLWAETSAQTIIAGPMVENRAACWMARRMGMRSSGERDGRAWFHLARA
jgi:hypothetical protein